MNDIYDRPLSRRQFLGVASCAALGTTGLFSTLTDLKMTSNAVAASLNAQAVAADDDYKALVCIFQAGGNDSFNMLIPTAASEYSQYQAVRGNLALPISGPGAALPLNAANTGGRTFALHPAMPAVQQLFNSGKAAFLANVGTLIEPTTVQQYKAGTVRLPKALFSHSDQIMQWQTSVPQGGSPSGWAGRIADLLNAQVNSGLIGLNISLAGNNMLQTGGQTTTYTISPGGSISLVGKNAVGPVNLLRYDKFTSMADVQYQNLFAQAYLNELKQSVAKDELFSTAFSAATLQTVFAANDLADDLQAVARTIQIRQALGVKRQIFFVLYGGWDHHQELLETQEEMLGVLSQALQNFWEALGELGMQEKVVTFTSSDFGRTLRSNGRGTDHAWGGNHLVLGGPVLGQRIYGNYPEDLRLGGGLDVGGNGRLAPTTAVDQYMAELALWFGLARSDLSTVFPNIANFYNPTSTSLPIGFLTV